MTHTANCYLLDTSVILDDPANILRISENNQNTVAITNIVVAELNNKKDDMRSDAGFRAREFFRLADNCDGDTVLFDDLPDCLKACTDKNSCHDDKYYKLSINFDKALHAESVEPITLYIIFRESYRAATRYTEAKGLNDAKIGEIAKDYSLVLLTNDISFKIAAHVQGIHAESIRNASVEDPNAINFTQTYSYTEEPTVPKEHGHTNFDQLTFVEEAESQSSEIYETGIQRHALYHNHQIEWCDFDRRFGEHFDDALIRPINLEQKFYFSILTHPQNFVSVVSGSTGSGKTLMALQAGLELLNEGIIEGIVYTRNTVTTTDQHAELGFRKGDEEQKLGYFMYPLYAAINFTIEHQNKHSIESQVEYTGNTNSVKRENATEIFMAKNNIEVMDIAHLRGTTISKKLVIIDEAQNMTSATLKLIGTRMGEETRLVIMGDVNQIDHPFLSKRRNALVDLLHKAQNHDFIAGVQLRHTIRSEVANWFDKNL
ncbi:MAG TPA: phosphate starvation-inducible protein PhoH [Helicobacteraceae bacterium]|nr:phosphate starvation-inducible protein PhoH [Helicobacteraceae bacterium]